MSGDFEVTLDELREVARFALGSAEALLPVFEATHLDDPRPRAAVEAARLFAGGAPRTKLQRVTSLDAHRAAREAPTEPARLAAQACGDAASAAYLHPLAQATQVGHILRATAAEAWAAELLADDEAAADGVLERARGRASDTVRDVLRRYPAAPIGRSRVAVLMSELDASLRWPDVMDDGGQSGQPP